jgi:hypothetical protein
MLESHLAIENRYNNIKSIDMGVNRKTIELTRLADFGRTRLMITASQCRAARGLLDWTQQELADAARIGVATVRVFEGEAAETRPAILAALRRALELAGVEFIDENGGGLGVRYRKRQRSKPTR